MEDYKALIYKLLDPIPQYVLGCLPALGIMGESPANRFTEKVTWLFRCLGCPFTALFYSINIGSNKESRCMYWLSSSRFVTDEGRKLRHKPFGFNACEITNGNDPDIKKCIERCTATASVLERWSSLVSAYFIVVGMLALISKATGNVSCPDWPYIPSLFSWTIPAIWRRAFSGNMVIKDPDEIFRDHSVIVRVNPKLRIHKRTTVFVTAFISVVYPLMTLLLAYYSPPIGYGCRSKFITIFCAIWAFNSILALVIHCAKEKDLTSAGRGFFHVYFAFCGFIVAVLLIFLGLLSKNNQWWIDLFGDSCSLASAGCM